MADQRHIIDVILQARDNTAAAVADATRNLKGFEEAAERVGREQARQNEAARKSYADLNREIAVNQQKYGALVRQIAEAKGITKDQVDQVVKLESATRNYVKALGDENATAARRAQALGQMREAQQKLNEALVESNDLSQKQAKAITDEIVARQKQIEQAQQLARIQAEAARDINAQIDERKRKQAELNRILDQSDREAAQRREQENREIQEMERNRQKLIDERIRKQNELNRIINQSEREAQQRREQENREIQELERNRQRAMDERIRKQQELNRILDRSDREAAQRREQENRELQALLKTRRDAAAEQERQRERELKLGRQYIQQIEQISRIERERNAAREAGDFTTTARLDFDAREARNQAERLAAELQALFAHIEAQVDFDDAAAKAHAAEILAMKEVLGRDLKIDVDIDVDAADIAKVNALNASLRDTDRSARQAGGGIGFLTGLIKAVGDGFDGSSQRVASFDNYLRGLLSLGVALFLNQLILLAGAAAGALLALASSAAMAGSALGGALTAGIAQAIPMLGILGAAATRFAAIMEAVQQANLLQQQQSYQGAQQAKTLADAQDTLVSAQERVEAANDNVADAQDRLNQSYEDARRALQDLILQQQGLTLSIEENEEAIRKAASRGQTAQLPRLFLRREELEVQQTRVTEEIQERRSGKPPEVEAAEDALEQAKRAADQAQRQAERAGRAAEVASAGITAAAGKLNFLLGQMSDAERRLFETITELQDKFRGVAQTITEPIILATDRALRKLMELMDNRALIGAFTELAEEMAEQGTKMFDALTSPEMIDRFIGFIEEAKENLEPLTDSIINLGQAFFDVAESAGPALSDILEWLEGITEKISEFFDVGNRSGELTQFFEDGVEHLKAWGDLVWQVIRLFAALAGPGGGARTGLQLVNDMADGIRKWADAISEPTSKVNEFFQRFFRLSRQMLEALAPVFRSIGNEIDKTFTDDGLTAVEGFATFMADVLIPAVFEFARFLGQVTARIGEFVREHPRVAEFAASFLAASLAIGVLSKALTIFGPLLRPLGFIAGYFLRASGAIGVLNAGLQILTVLLRAAVGFILGPWGLAIGIFVLLAAKLGLLDDLIRALRKPFEALWEQVEPPLRRAYESFKDLFDAISEGTGAFIVLRPILKIIIDLLGYFLEAIGRSIGKVIGGLIDVISGFVEILTGLLTGDFGKAWEGLKRIVEGAGRAIIGIVELVLLRGLGKVFGSLIGLIRTGAVKAFEGLLSVARNVVPAVMRFLLRLPGRIVGFLGDVIFAIRNGLPALEVLFRTIGRRIFDTLSSGFSRVFNFMKDLPGKMLGFIKDLPGKIVDIFKGLGGKIAQVIFAGATNLAGAGKDLANSLIDLINEILPNKIPIPGPIPDIPLPDNPIPKFAKGGRIGTGFGGGDRRLILAEDGEWVIRKERVAQFGNAFMALINGGWGDSSSRFQTGGQVRQGAGMGGQTVIAQALVDESADIGEQAHRWREMLHEIVASTQRNTALIEKQFRDMRVNITATLRRLYNDGRDYIAALQKSFATRGKDIADTWGGMFDSLTNVTFKGLDYIGKAVSRALEELGENGIRFSLSRPSSNRSSSDWTSGPSTDRAPGGRFASGGVVGNFGERGGDTELTWLGRGEAVLNWAHQKIVNSALWQTYGTTLPEMFKRNFAYHAGGPGRAPGYATGRMPDLDGALPGFGPFMQYFRAKFGKNIYVMSGFRPGSITTSGNVSNHASRQAVDISTPAIAGATASNPPPTTNVDRLHAFISRYLPAPPRLDFLWRTMTGGNHFNHIHLGISEAIVNSIKTARAWISKHFPEGGAFGGDVVKLRQLLGPDGALKKLGNTILEKTTKAANKFFEKKLDESLGGMTMDGDSMEFGEGTLSFNDVAKLAESVGLPGITFAQIAKGESSLNPKAVGNDPGGTQGLGLWQITTGFNDDIIERFGGRQAMFDPYKNALAAKAIYDRQGIGAWYGTKFMTGTDLHYQGRALGGFVADAIQEFATGGQIQGPDGAPTPILAHAGEWVLNKMQQSRMAELLGTTVGKLRDFLGFKGGPGSFQDGGVIPRFGRATEGGRYQLPLIDPTTLASLQREIETVYKAIDNISTKSKVGRQIDLFLKAIRRLTDEEGYLDSLGAALEALSTRLERTLALAQVGYRRVRNRLVRIPPLTDAVEIADRTVDNLAEIAREIRRQRRISEEGLSETQRRIRQIERGGVTKEEQERYYTLIAARGRFQQELDNLDQQWAENREAMYEAQVQRFEAQTQADLRSTGERSSFLDMQERIANAFGQRGVLASIAQAQLGVLQEQQIILQNRLNEAIRLAATDGRWQSIADELASQLRETTVSIAEAQANILTTQIDAINARFEEWQRMEGLAERRINLRERLGGDRLRLNWDRQVLAASRQNTLSLQADELRGALGAAINAGNEDAVRSLTAQIQELEIAIEEENATRRELVLAYRETATEIITGRSSRTTGLIGTARSIFQSVGDITGDLNLDVIRGLINQTLGTLRQTATQIVNNINQAITGNEFGSTGSSILGQLRTAFSRGPEQFASTLARLAPAIAQLESTMSEAERTAFQALIESMIDNTTAVVDNTSQLEDLNGRDTQNWSSTAWRWFNEAIFSGMGDVLPRFPQMATGGYITKDGLFSLHAGEFVINAERSNLPPMGDNINIEINEAGQPIDVQHLVSRLAFEKKSRGR